MSDSHSPYLCVSASMIQGNRANCAQFAQVSRLDWLVDRLQTQQASKGVLQVLHCVLIDSPEALTMIKEPHIQNIISLLDKHGRDPKVRLSLHIHKLRNIVPSICVDNFVSWPSLLLQFYQWLSHCFCDIRRSAEGVKKETRWELIYFTAYFARTYALGLWHLPLSVILFS